MYRLQPLVTQAMHIQDYREKVHNRIEGVKSFYTISLFSVDQIRERSSPWRALPEIVFPLSRQHKERSIKRSSPFKQRLQERKKVCMLYGNLSKRLLNCYIKKASRPEDVIFFLESRLDIVLKRSSLFPCIKSARKSILQGGISVNHQIVYSPRYHCTPGDIIKVLQNPRFVRKNVDQCCSTRASKGKYIEYTQQRKQVLYPIECTNLFAFSERLILWDRKIGRLHKSVLQNQSRERGLVKRTHRSV